MKTSFVRLLLATFTVCAAQFSQVAMADTETYVNVANHETLRSNGTSATIIGSCGMTSYPSWNTDDVEMKGQSCGGPTCGLKSPVTGKAKFVGPNIVLLQGHSQYVFVPSAQGIGGMICL